MIRMQRVAWIIALITVVGVPFDAFADNFIEAHYDATTDELVVTMRYRGTSPDHTFTIQWGECKHSTGDDPKNQLSAAILDGHWDDAARTPFKKVARFGLVDMPCRPAAVTLHTAPRFYYRVNIPAASR